MNIEKIEAVYVPQMPPGPQGDDFITNRPFFGVMDGFNPPHHYKMEKPIFYGMDGEEMVRKAALSTFYSAQPDQSLEDIILKANQKINQIQTACGIPVDQAGLRAGASFAFAKVNAGTIEIVQGGDCFAVVSYISGKIGVTKNRAYQHVSENLLIIDKLLEKHGGDSREMWVEFCPVLSERRQRDINQEKGYASLNGQPTLEKCWQKISLPTDGLQFLLLFSDGFVLYPETANGLHLKMAEKMVESYRKSGIGGFLEKKIRESEKNPKTSYVRRDEAAAVAATFA